MCSRHSKTFDAISQCDDILVLFASLRRTSFDIMYFVILADIYNMALGKLPWRLASLDFEQVLGYHLVAHNEGVYYD